MSSSDSTTQSGAAEGVKTISQSIAEHVVACDYSALSPAAVTAAKMLMLDTLAVAWSGTSAPGAPEAHALLVEEGGRSDATVWGFGGKLPAMSATFINSISGAALDYDAVDCVHAAVITLPTALAFAQREHKSGREFLAAYVIGSDLCSRFGGAITGEHKGWYTTSIYGSFGAAATASKLLGLDAIATRHALGISLSQAAGTQQPNIEQSLSKRLQPALAARAGVFSALLAQRGITAPSEPIEGRFGLFALYQQGDPSRIIENLGRHFEHEKTAVKKYPCCACTHAAVEAVLVLVREYDLKPDDVTAIEVRLSPFMNRLVGAPFNPGDNPQVSAQFSIQYTVACALLRRRMTVADIQEGAIFDPSIRPITERIRIVVEDAWTSNRAPAAVTMMTRQYGKISRTTEKFPWSPEDPPTAAALQEKLDACFAEGGNPLTREQVGLLVGRVKEIESVRDMSRFFEGII